MTNRWILSCGVVLLAACSGNDDPSDLARIGNRLVYTSREALQCESDGITPAESAQRLIDAGVDVIESTCGLITGVASIKPGSA
jgi:hypothetical protein